MKFFCRSKALYGGTVQERRKLCAARLGSGLLRLPSASLWRPALREAEETAQVSRVVLQERWYLLHEARESGEAT